MLPLYPPRDHAARADLFGRPPRRLFLRGRASPFFLESSYIRIESPRPFDFSPRDGQLPLFPFVLMITPAAARKNSFLFFRFPLLCVPPLPFPATSRLTSGTAAWLACGVPRFSWLARSFALSSSARRFLLPAALLERLCLKSSRTAHDQFPFSALHTFPLLRCVFLRCFPSSRPRSSGELCPSLSAFDHFSAALIFRSLECAALFFRFLP